MSGEKQEDKGRGFTKTDTSEKKKVAEKKRADMDKGLKNVLGILRGEAFEITDSSPILKHITWGKIRLKDIMVQVGSISQPQVKIGIGYEIGPDFVTRKIELEEGVNKIDASIDIPAGATVIVNANHPADFRIEDFVFSAKIINI